MTHHTARFDIPKPGLDVLTHVDVIANLFIAYAIGQPIQHLTHALFGLQKLHQSALSLTIYFGSGFSRDARNTANASPRTQPATANRPCIKTISDE